MTGGGLREGQKGLGWAWGMPAPHRTVIPAKPVPDMCYRGAGIQGNGREPGAGHVGVGCGALPVSYTPVIPAKAGIQGNEQGARVRVRLGLGMGRLWGKEKRHWIPAYNLRE